MRIQLIVVVSIATLAVSACSTLPSGLIEPPGPSPKEPATAATSASLPIAWSKILTQTATRPVVIGDLAITTHGSNIDAVMVATGASVWSRNLSDPAVGSVYLGPPTLSQGRILTAASTAGLGGLYSFATDGSNTGSLAFHHFVGNLAADGSLTARVGGSYGSGTPALATLQFGRTWFVSFGGGPTTWPISITGGRAFMVAGGRVLGFDPTTPCTPVPPPFPFGYCTATWSTSIPGAQAAASAGGGRVAIGSTNGTLSVLNGATGAVEFTTANASTPLSPSSHGYQGRLFTTGGDGVLRVYNASGCGGTACAPLWTGAVGSASTVAPTVSNGKVYVATTDGRLVVFPAAGCSTPPCEPIAIGDSATGSAAGGRPLVTRTRILVPLGDQLVAFANL